jgi:hypothetical protein
MVPAPFVGAQLIGSSAVGLEWDTPLGSVWIAWDYPCAANKTLAQAVAQFPSSTAVTAIGGDFGVDGPAVWAVRPGIPGDRKYEIRWSKLAEVLGQPVPYWPFPLRIRELLEMWRPGSAPATAAAIPVQDPGPLLRLAAIVDQGSPPQRTLLNLAQTWQSRATADAEQDLGIMNRTMRPGTTIIAATPLQVPESSPDDLDETVRRAGWLQILARDDNLAALCARAMIMWDGGSDFLSSSPENIDSGTSYGLERAQRLIPAPRTAAIEQLDPNRDAVEILVDPETDAPVIRWADGQLSAAIPQRLPAVSPLAELILDKPIWVRTQDGTLYPAPQHPHYGINWGYSGSGPAALAVLADKLLADINATGGDLVTEAPDGLYELMTREWPKGTVLTRAQLQAAKDSRPGTS